MEVINGSLRGLSGTPTNTTKREAVPASKARTTSRLASAGSKVLQSRSENSGDISIPNLDAVDHLANCCSTSISFLISTESAEGAPSMQPLQTENARLSLSTKLIQLGRFETAMDELKLLKRRLQLVMNGGSGVESWLVELKTEDPVAKKTAGRVPTRPNISEADAKTEGEELSTLLEFPQVSTSSSAFILVISYQLAILRCIAGLKRPEMTEVKNPLVSIS